MIKEDLIFVGTPDIAGKLRGKSFPAVDLERRLKRGMGWVPTNAQITCFDTIAESPFGALGDLLLVPDPDTEVQIDFGSSDSALHFMLGDLRELGGEPWSLCARDILRKSLARLAKVSGLDMRASFEHEFHIKRFDRPIGDAFGLSGHRAAAAFASTFTAALRAAGLVPDSFVNEYGPSQYEATIAPKDALRAADEATIFRELAHAAAAHHDLEVSFTPLRDPDMVGNGLHVHFSFWDQEGRPATYDPKAPNGLAHAASAFAAGVLRHLPAIVALTAPSVISYARLVPHRWSAAFNNLGLRDREASLRICPTTAVDKIAVAQQYNLELRAADATATPHIALAAIIHAGAQGIEEGLAAPSVTETDLSLLSVSELEALGVARLPATLEAALACFANDPIAQAWFPGEFASVYRLHKLGEIAFLDGKNMGEICKLYEACY